MTTTTTTILRVETYLSGQQSDKNKLIRIVNELTYAIFMKNNLREY